jgi:hypothetical protein
VIAQPPSLEAFCADMRRLAVKAEVRLRLPACGDRGGQGWFVRISGDGKRLQLISREKTDLFVEADESDPDSLMEAVFVQATTSIGHILEPASGNPLDLANISDAEIKTRALAMFTADRAVQESILGNIEPSWRERQAKKNDVQLKRIEQMFK